MGRGHWLAGPVASMGRALAKTRPPHGAPRRVRGRWVASTGTAESWVPLAVPRAPQFQDDAVWTRRNHRAEPAPLVDVRSDARIPSFLLLSGPCVPHIPAQTPLSPLSASGPTVISEGRAGGRDGRWGSGRSCRSVGAQAAGLGVDGSVLRHRDRQEMDSTPRGEGRVAARPSWRVQERARPCHTRGARACGSARGWGADCALAPYGCATLGAGRPPRAPRPSHHAGRPPPGSPGRSDLAVTHSEKVGCRRAGAVSADEYGANRARSRVGARRQMASRVRRLGVAAASPPPWLAVGARPSAWPGQSRGFAAAPTARRI